MQYKLEIWVSSPPLQSHPYQCRGGLSTELCWCPWGLWAPGSHRAEQGGWRVMGGCCVTGGCCVMHSRAVLVLGTAESFLSRLLRGPGRPRLAAHPGPSCKPSPAQLSSKTPGSLKEFVISSLQIAFGGPVLHIFLCLWNVFYGFHCTENRNSAWLWRQEG